MEIILIFILCIMALNAYICSGKEILSPAFISILMFILSIYVAFLNKVEWDFVLSAKTAMVIILALLSLSIGEYASNYFLNKNGIKNIKKIDAKTYNEINVDNRFILCICICMLFITYKYFKYIFRISLLANNPFGYSAMLDYARTAMNNTSLDTGISTLLNHGLCAAKSVTYVFVFIFIYNTILFGFKVVYIKYMIPVLIYCTHAALSTGRTSFMYLIITMLLIYFVVLKKVNGWNNYWDFKIIKYGILGIVCFIAIFRVMAFVAGKTYISSLWDSLSLYIGSPILALNIFLKQPSQISNYFGEESLYGINAILRAIGLDMPGNIKQLEFVSQASVTTNIYTSLRRYINDFGLLGMNIIMFGIGVGYNIFLNIIKKSSRIGFLIILYGCFFYPIVEIAIEERVFMNIVSLSSVYQIIYMWIIYYLCIKSNSNRKKGKRLKFNIHF